MENKSQFRFCLTVGLSKQINLLCATSITNPGLVTEAEIC